MSRSSLLHLRTVLLLLPRALDDFAAVVEVSLTGFYISGSDYHVLSKSGSNLMPIELFSCEAGMSGHLSG